MIAELSLWSLPPVVANAIPASGLVAYNRLQLSCNGSHRQIFASQQIKDTKIYIMKYFERRPWTFILSVLIAMVFAMWFLTSCSSVHKVYSKEISHLDSTGSSKEESATLSKHDSLVIKEGNETWQRETVIEYDGNDTNGPYLGALNFEPSYSNDKKLPYVPFSPINGHNNLDVSTKSKYGYRPSKITIREKGSNLTKQTGTYHNSDSNHQTKENNATVKKDEKKIDKDKKTSRPPYVGIAIGLALIAVLGWLYYKDGKKVKGLV